MQCLWEALQGQWLLGVNQGNGVWALLEGWQGLLQLLQVVLHLVVHLHVLKQGQAGLQTGVQLQTVQELQVLQQP